MLISIGMIFNYVAFYYNGHGIENIIFYLNSFKRGAMGLYTMNCMINIEVIPWLMNHPFQMSI